MASEGVSILPVAGKLDPCTLFAYPSSSALYFSPHASMLQRQSDAEVAVDSGNTFSSRRSSSASESEFDQPTAARRTSLLAKTVVESCILEDEPDSDYDVVLQAQELAKDQLGCRYLQTKLEAGGSRLTQAVFERVLPSLGELILHPFGNYLCQKLIEGGSRMQLEVLMEVVAPVLVDVAVHVHGTRVVQKLIEEIATTSLVPQLRALLQPSVLDLSRDLNGSHVIQRCLSSWPAVHTQFIYDAVCANVLLFATHRNGCCVLQRCVDFASQTQFQVVAQAVVSVAIELVKDAFGNYAVQYVLDCKNLHANKQLAAVITPHLYELSRQKFASNVIEKCLQLNDPEVQQSMIRAIGDTQRVGELLCDQYANYVVQRALTLAKPQLLQRLLAMIRPSLDSLRGSPVGQRVFAKLVKRYPALVDRARRTQSMAFA